MIVFYFIYKMLGMMITRFYIPYYIRKHLSNPNGFIS